MKLIALVASFVLVVLMLANVATSLSAFVLTFVIPVALAYLTRRVWVGLLVSIFTGLWSLNLVAGSNPPFIDTPFMIFYVLFYVPFIWVLALAVMSGAEDESHV